MYNKDTDITQLPKKIIKPETIYAFLAGKQSPLVIVKWRHVVKSCRSLSINPIFILARVIFEAGWNAESGIARLKNNILGWNARDKDPFRHATVFASWTDCVLYVIHDLHRYYFHRKVIKPNEKNYRTIDEVMERYSTAKDSQSTANLMNQIEAFRVKVEENS